MGSETGGNKAKRRRKITGSEREAAPDGRERSGPAEQGPGLPAPMRRLTGGTGYLIKPSSETAPVPDAIQTLMQTPISFR